VLYINRNRVFIWRHFKSEALPTQATWTLTTVRGFRNWSTHGDERSTQRVWDSWFSCYCISLNVKLHCMILHYTHIIMYTCAELNRCLPCVLRPNWLADQA